MNKIFIGIAVISFAVASCEQEDTIPERFTPNNPTNSNVKFLMMAPDAPEVNFFVNGIKSSAVSPTSTGIVKGMVFPSLFPSTIGYTTVPGGSVTIDAKVTDSSAVTPGAVLLSSPQTLDPNKFYTYVLMDSVHKITSALLEDDPSVPDPTKAYYRLANFVSNGNTAIFEVARVTGFSYPYPVIRTLDLNFKTATAFDTLSGGVTYRFYLRHPTTNAKLDSISNFTPTPTKKYTIYGRGVLGLTGTNAKRPIITNYVNF